MVHFFHEGGGPYLKGENPLTPSSIINTGLIDGVPPLSANGPLRFIRIIYMGQAHKSNRPLAAISQRDPPAVGSRCRRGPAAAGSRRGRAPPAAGYQAHKSNNPPPDLKYPFIDFTYFSLLFDIPVF